MDEFFKIFKKSLKELIYYIPSILISLLLIPNYVSAETIVAEPDQISFYRAYDNTLVGSDSTMSTYKFSGNTFFGGTSGNATYSPNSARILYRNSQFASVPKNKTYTLMFTLFSTKPISSVSLDTNQVYATCNIFNTSFYDFNDSNDGIVYSVYCPKMQFVSSNLYFNVSFAQGDNVNFPLGIQNTFTYYSDTTAQEIIDGINGEDIPQTPVDDSKVEDYESKEEGLIDKDSLDKIDDIEIAIDSNSNLFIWNIVENILNTHELIFSMIITLLSIGVIKLILNR